MKKLLFIFIISCFVACANGTGKVNPDSSNIITDSAALKNADSTGVLGSTR